MIAPKDGSIRQNDYPNALPDFRNLGVIARILLIVNGGALFAAAVRARGLVELGERIIEIGAWVEPALIMSLVVLYALSRQLSRPPFQYGLAFTLVLVMLCAAASATLQARLVANIESLDVMSGNVAASMAYAAIATGIIAWYFHLRRRAFSPALAEARLQALQARIRPHFLFNSLNAVLSLIRSDSRRAETALEDLAELFRNLMADNRSLVTLREETALCRQYLSLEHLRLGDRLQVNWATDPADESALVPPMLLQPLVENAVYHGIEPGVGAGTIEIRIRREGERLHIQLVNPYHPEHHHRQGNHMALANIRERLQLHFDVEASLETRVDGDRFRIDMALPFRTAA